MGTIQEKVEELLQEKEKHRKVKDVGRVAHSKKERAAYRIISKENIDEINKDEITAFNLVKKEAIWESIDIDEQKQLGVSAGACYIKVKIRESLPAKPENNKLNRKVYVYFLDLLQKDLLPIKTVQEVKLKINEYLNETVIDQLATFIDPEFETYSDERKKEVINEFFPYGNWYRIRHIIIEMLGKKFHNMISNGSDAALQNWKNAKIYQASPGREEEATRQIMERRKAKLDRGVEMLENSNALDTRAFFDYVKKNFTHVGKMTYGDFISERGRMNEMFFRNFIKDKAIKAQMEFDKPIELEPQDKKREDDWSWAEKENKDGTVKVRTRAINTKIPLAYIKRSGGYKTPEPTPENVVNYYGFVAYNFGRYVPDKERGEHARHFIAALTDLGEILNMDIKQVHELVGLGFGVGLKGHGGHLAAYFPQTKDINLVRGKGDGSVAHEWGHFFDNMVADFKLKKAEPTWGTEGLAQDELLRDYFRDFRMFCSKGVEGAINYKTRVFQASKSDSAYASIAILGTIEESIKALLDRNPAYSYYEPGGRYAEGNQEKYFGYIIGKHGLSEYPVKLKLRTSVFFQDSRNAGSNSKYWISTIEMFARSFETYVFHKMAKAGLTNNYLAHDSYLAEGMPYPRGDEYDAIEKIIDKIFDRFREAYNIRPFTPIINERITEEITEIESGKEEEKTEPEDSTEKPETKEEKAMVTMIRKPQAKPALRKEFLREEEGLKLYLVDGEQLRKTHIEFVSGGHGYVYDYIPKDEVWIDENQKDKPNDMEATIKHELFEIKKMRDEGLSYDDAHELANAMEKEVRNETNTVTDSDIQNAEQVGRDAFKSGKMRTPAQDSVLMGMLKGGEVGTNTPLLTAWLKGWDSENLKAPVEEPEDDRTETEQVTDEVNEMFEGATTEEAKDYNDPDQDYINSRLEQIRKGTQDDSEKEYVTKIFWEKEGKDDKLYVVTEDNTRLNILNISETILKHDHQIEVWSHWVHRQYFERSPYIKGDSINKDAIRDEIIRLLNTREINLIITQEKNILSSAFWVYYSMDKFEKPEKFDYETAFNKKFKVGDIVSLIDTTDEPTMQFYNKATVLKYLNYSNKEKTWIVDIQMMQDNGKTAVNETNLIPFDEYLDKGKNGRDELIAKILSIEQNIRNGEKLMLKPSFTGDVTKDIEKDKQKLAALKAEFRLRFGTLDIVRQEEPEQPKTALIREYDNDFELNKAIEKLLDSKWNDPVEKWSGEELEFLKGYSGYGGLDEYGEISKGSLFEFYTPEKVIEKMWGLAYKYGYKDGRLLEPSSGIGLFLKRDYVKSSVIKDAYEINKYSAKICKLLYPETNVNDGDEKKYFEQLFIKNNYTVRDKITPVHELVIGNPPYGEAQSLYLGMGEKTYSHARNYIDYFILRGLDMLVKDGLLIYIIGAEVAAGGKPWLDAGPSKCKEMITERGKLIDAYRLPEGLFARTNVVSDLIVFRKKG